MILKTWIKTFLYNHLLIGRRWGQDRLPWGRFLYRLRPSGLWNTLHHLHLSAHRDKSSRHIQDLMQLSWCWSQRSGRSRHRLRRDITKLWSLQSFICWDYCFYSDLKILPLHLEQRMWTHGGDVNVSGRDGATDCAVDAFSRHPHLRRRRRSRTRVNKPVESHDYNFSDEGTNICWDKSLYMCFMYHICLLFWFVQTVKQWFLQL